MENLFGSDYDSEEEEFKASRVKESPARDGGRSNEDLFRDEAGDRGASGGGDGDNGYSDNMWLPRAPKAPETAKYFISKMPNILRLVPEPYTKEAIRAEMDNPSDETLSAGATNATLLLAACCWTTRPSCRCGNPTLNWCNGRTARSPCLWAKRH
ncbi:hypothetical protein PC121_g13741 [Phytophthora cactorum]|nr:hypothetical protein PC120_g11747 [Phytophthora cactorum]KAG3059893.1 hypothetical protein PC121_g13741 [Phytophthora cactorum]